MKTRLFFLTEAIIRKKLKKVKSFQPARNEVGSGLVDTNVEKCAISFDEGRLKRSGYCMWRPTCCRVNRMMIGRGVLEFGVIW